MRSTLLFLALLLAGRLAPEAQRSSATGGCTPAGCSTSPCSTPGELGRPYSAGGTVVEGRPSLEWPRRSPAHPGPPELPRPPQLLRERGVGRRDARLTAPLRVRRGGLQFQRRPGPRRRRPQHAGRAHADRELPRPRQRRAEPGLRPGRGRGDHHLVWDTPTGHPGHADEPGLELPRLRQLHHLRVRVRERHQRAAPGRLRHLRQYVRPVDVRVPAESRAVERGALRGQPPAGLGDHFARYDLRRWMTYNHTRNGKPEPSASSRGRSRATAAGSTRRRRRACSSSTTTTTTSPRAERPSRCGSSPPTAPGCGTRTAAPSSRSCSGTRTATSTTRRSPRGWTRNLRRRTSIWQSVRLDSTRFSSQFDPTSGATGGADEHLGQPLVVAAGRPRVRVLPLRPRARPEPSVRRGRGGGLRGR
jgi:hypothetical protein